MPCGVTSSQAFLGQQTKTTAFLYWEAFDLQSSGPYARGLTGAECLQQCRQENLHTQGSQSESEADETVVISKTLDTGNGTGGH